MVTVIAETVTVTEAAALESASEVAVRVTGKSLAGGGGAEYVVAAPPAVDVGETVPQGDGEQDTVQVTPLLLES